MQLNAKIINGCKNKWSATWYVVNRMVGLLKLETKFSDGHMSLVYIKETAHICLFMTGKVLATPVESVQNYTFYHAAYCV